MESVATFVWNRWQLWRGIGGRIHLESVAALAWNTQLLQPHTLRRQFQATYNSIRHHHDGVPSSRLRELLRWPRERFDAVLEALRADQHVELEVLKDNALEAQARQDSYDVHGQLYVRVRWRD